MVSAMQEVFSHRLGVEFMPYPEELEELLQRFSAQTLLAGMTALRAEFRKRKENPANFQQDELLSLLELRCSAIDNSRNGQ